MRREHPVAREDQVATLTDHRGKPRRRPRIRRIAVIRSDSLGFRIVSNLSGPTHATRP